MGNCGYKASSFPRRDSRHPVSRDGNLTQRAGRHPFSDIGRQPSASSPFVRKKVESLRITSSASMAPHWQYLPLSPLEAKPRSTGHKVYQYGENSSLQEGSTRRKGKNLRENVSLKKLKTEFRDKKPHCRGEKNLRHESLPKAGHKGKTQEKSNLDPRMKEGHKRSAPRHFEDPNPPQKGNIRKITRRPIGGDSQRTRKTQMPDIREALYLVTHLELSKSDHRGLLVVAETSMERKESSFRFQHMWATHLGFLEVMRWNWQYPTLGSGMVRLQQKLIRLKHCLKDWNKAVFGNVVDRVVEAERNLKEADEAYDLDPCDRMLVEQNWCSAVLVRALVQEKAFWKQKAGIKWAKDGREIRDISIRWLRKRDFGARFLGFNMRVSF
ncbi:UNVERIFIED_CONTAM: hypothetical protein Slati_0490700 [Sesamum latifolium]|uniref:Uncharacterized protein n=1 Tax=Sesamum latifolium TaxID=2727402 RepID=A0AAW2XXA3_9LAMI